MKFQHLLAGALLASLGAAGCRDSSVPAAAARPDPNVVIARFKGGEIRRGTIQGALDRRFAAAPKPLSSEVRKAIVRQIVERRVRTAMLFEEAEAKGFGKRSEVESRQAVAEDRTLAEEFLARAMAGAKASDAQVAAEIDRRVAASHPEEARKFSHIFLRAPESDATARKAAADRMAKIRQEADAGTGFNKLAEKWSDSVTARGGGRIDWTLRRSLNKLAAEAIFTLKEGEVSQVVSAPDGLHLFRLDGVRPGTPLDMDAVRRNVRQSLDDEAKRAAERARRQQEVDAQGAEFAAPEVVARLATAPGGAGSQVMAHWRGGEVRGSDQLAVAGWVTLAPQPLAGELRTLVENRLLAAARRAEPISAELTARVADARRLAVINSYRQTLIAGLDTGSTEEEIARYYRDHAESLLALRDFEIDALFFPQTGESVADVYTAGEEVGDKLRDGVSFDDILRVPVRTGARLCRAQHGVDLTALGQTSLRLRKALLSLSAGEITPAIYLDGPQTVLVPKSCVLDGRGVAFLRLRALGTLPLPAVRDSIRTALAKEKEAAGIEQIQNRLIAASGLQIVVPEG